MTETLVPRPANGSAGVSSVNLSTSYLLTEQAAQWIAPQAIARTRKVAIIGFGETAKDCPWKDDSWELWAMNGWWRAAKPDYGVEAPEERYTLWLDMHSVEFTKAYGEQAGFGDAQHEWLKKEHPFPILMLSEYTEYPSVQAYPLADVVGALGREYFTSTIAYALAFAMIQPDIAEIGLWGIDLVHDTEYGDQRPCAEYWIGRAEALGIKVTIHAHSALLKQRQRYGYEAANPLLEQVRAYLAVQIKSIPAAIEKHQGEMDRLRCQMHTDDGALQMARQLAQRLDIWERGGVV